MQAPLEARRVREGPSLSLRRNQPCPHIDVSPHPAIPASHSVLQKCQAVSMWVCCHVVDRRPSPAVAGSLPGASRLCSLQERQPQPAALTHRPPSSRAVGFSRGQLRAPAGGHWQSGALWRDPRGRGHVSPSNRKRFGRS